MRIAICGKIRSGKDTLANILEEEYGFKNFKLSKGITEIIKEYFPDNYEGNRKMREHYQHIGQSMRDLDEDVWVNKTKAEINSFLNTHGEDSDILISDLRQMNEYEFLKRNGFTIIKVESDIDIRAARAMREDDYFDDSSFYHETELSVDVISEDYLIENDGTLDELKKSINELMIHIILDELENK